MLIDPIYPGNTYLYASIDSGLLPPIGTLNTTIHTNSAGKSHLIEWNFLKLGDYSSR